jgi:hypothetical protein
MRKFVLILLVILVVALATLYFVWNKEEAVTPVNENSNNVATTTDTVKPASAPIISFGTPVCETVSGKRYAKIPITISDEGWSYGETSVKPIDTNITSSSGKTFENIGMSYPFPEFVSEDWGATVVTVKLWKDKNKNPLVTRSYTALVKSVCE